MQVVFCRIKMLPVTCIYILSLLIPHSSPCAPIFDTHFEFSAGYRQETVRDFERAPARLQLLQAALHLLAQSKDYPLSLGYLFKAPIADLGSDDIGIQEGLSYANGLEFRYRFDLFLPVFEPYLSLAYIFYGSSKLKAKSRLAGRNSNGELVRVPEADISMRTRDSGYHFDLGVKYKTTNNSAFIFGISREIMRKKLEFFTLNGIDQSYLVDDIIRNTIYTASKVFCGYQWSF